MGRPNVNWNVGIAIDKHSTYTSKAVKAGIPFASQVTEPNTKYIIKYDFSLGGETVEMPENCTLEFSGGSLRNGVLQGNHTTINEECAYNIFNDCIVEGFDLSCLDLRWFGGVSDYDEETKEGTDNAVAFERCLNHIGLYYNGIGIRLVGQYYLGTTVKTTYDLNIFGFHNNSRDLTGHGSSERTSPSLLAIGDNTGFEMIGRGAQGSNTKYCNISLHNIKVIGIVVDDNLVSRFIYYTAEGAPSRPSTITECEFSRLGTVLEFHGKHPATQSDTIMGNLLVLSCYAYLNGKFIYAHHDSGIRRTLNNLAIRDSVIEHNHKNCIDITNAHGSVVIDNNCLEGEDSPLRFMNTRGPVTITNNYFEQTGDFAVDAKSLDYRQKMVFRNNYNETLDSFKVKMQGYDIDGGQFKLLDEGSVFQGCVINEDYEYFNLNWIAGFCFFSKFKEGCEKYLMNESRYIFNGMVCTKIPTNEAGIGNVEVSDVDTPVTIAFYCGTKNDINTRLYKDANNIVDQPVYAIPDTMCIWRNTVPSTGTYIFRMWTGSSSKVGYVGSVSDWSDATNVCDITLATIDTVIRNNTGHRPTFDGMPFGYRYFDVTLGKMIYWTGAPQSRWTDEKGFAATINKGLTSQRPVGKHTEGGVEVGVLEDPYDIGYEYFDTTLKQPIYVKAISGETVTWVDATGTTV